MAKKKQTKTTQKSASKVRSDVSYGLPCTIHLAPFVLIASIVIVFGICFIKAPQRSTIQPSQLSMATQPAKIKPFDFVSKSFMLDGQTISGDILDRTVSDSGLKAVAIVINNPGGSGTFYYLVGAQMLDGREVYSKPILLDDRIQVNSVSVSDDGIILVQYLTHSASEPMSASPTKKVTAKFAFQDDGNLISVLH